MKSWYQKNPLKQEIEIEEFVSSDSEIEEFLAQMQLLELVPFPYLLPEPEVLGLEQMCFFYLDEKWIYHMIQGALSIGSVSALEQMCDRVIHQKRFWESRRRAGNLRRGFFGLPQRKDAQESVRTGFLLRSEAVRCWPGIEVKCSSTSFAGEAEQELEILRLDRISNDTLICIAAGEIGAVELAQPEEGIYFEVPEEIGRLRNNQGRAGKDGVLDIETMTASYSKEQVVPEYFAAQMLHKQKRYTFTPKYEKKEL